MKRLILAFGFLLSLAACEKDDNGNNDNEIPDGQLPIGLYKGTFSRSGGDVVDVSISFFENKFEGQSTRQKYPAICGGSYGRDNSSITFTDSCVWTADFDWTLILDGRYNLTENGADIRIWRTNGLQTDEYLLRRMSR